MLYVIDCPCLAEEGAYVPVGDFWEGYQRIPALAGVYGPAHMSAWGPARLQAHIRAHPSALVHIHMPGCKRVRRRARF